MLKEERHELPAPFRQQLICDMGESEASALMEALESTSPTSIRLNPYKVPSKPELRAVPWSRYGFYLDERPSFTLDAAFHGGHYYVQEASSQFIAHLLSGVDLEGARLLDLCAAPGGKSTLYSTMVGLEGLVLANEINRQRCSVLADNIRKWGLGNVVVSNNEPAAIARFSSWFDVVAIDAPCSGEGMFRKLDIAREQWSEQNVEQCVTRGEQIMREGFASLKAGGIFIYSTCTFNRRENEQQVAAFELWAEGQIAPFEDVECDESWGVVAERVGSFQSFRLMPHRLEGEGFFVAIARKSFDAGGKTRAPKGSKSIFTNLDRSSLKVLSTWVMQPELMQFYGVGEKIYGYYSAQMEGIKRLAESLHVVYSGVAMGQIFKGSLKPDSALALFHDINREACPTVALEGEQALDYLRKKEIDAEPFTEGINLVSSEGAMLGFAKRVGRRVNNLYSNSLKILKI